MLKEQRVVPVLTCASEGKLSVAQGNQEEL